MDRYPLFLNVLCTTLSSDLTIPLPSGSKALAYSKKPFGRKDPLIAPQQLSHSLFLRQRNTQHRIVPNALIH